MEFIFETTYDKKALTAMARAVRKTARRKRNKRSHILGWLVIALGILLILPIGEREFGLDGRTVITGLAVIVMTVTLLFEDWINGYVAGKRMLPGMSKSVCTFTEEEYVSQTEAGTTTFPYQNVDYIAENQDYFFFVFGNNHAQVYDKKHMTGGTPESFKTFITEKTGKIVQRI